MENKYNGYGYRINFRFGRRRIHQKKNYNSARKLLFNSARKDFVNEEEKDDYYIDSDNDSVFGIEVDNKLNSEDTDDNYSVVNDSKTDAVLSEDEDSIPIAKLLMLNDRKTDALLSEDEDSIPIAKLLKLHSPDTKSIKSFNSKEKLKVINSNSIVTKITYNSEGNEISSQKKRINKRITDTNTYDFNQCIYKVYEKDSPVTLIRYNYFNNNEKILDIQVEKVLEDNYLKNNSINFALIKKK